MPDPRYTRRQSIFGRFIDFVLVRGFRFINRFRPWHKIGKWLGLGNLLAYRVELRRYNLHDTDGDLTQPKVDVRIEPPPPGSNEEPKRIATVCPFHQGPNATHMRTEDGTMNDLNYPAMGCRFSRLGRNMQTKRPIESEIDFLKPDPFLISEKLMRRKDKVCKPATSLNLLAGAWIQFQVHDWFGHENEKLAPNDDDPANAGKKIAVPRASGTPMVIAKTRPDPTADQPLNARFEVYRNKDPQWWDASQVYSESVEETLRLRTDPKTGKLAEHGKLFLEDGCYLPLDPKTGISLSGFTDNWWLGLELLHTLFAKEHNSICDALKKNEPHLTDQEIFETARLVNCAILAKIHTVEWTPGILGHPSIQVALNANWKGLFGHFFGERAARGLAPWIPQGMRDVVTGIPMSEPDHHGAPYALTEEFNSVYRLHPLIPEEVKIVRSGTNTPIQSYAMTEIAFTKSRTPLTKDQARWEDVIYSFGTSHPGQITIQNYPSFLQDLTLPPDPDTGRVQKLDLAAVDIIRDRERGVPRYCEFRRQLRMKVPVNWIEMAGAYPHLASTLEEIYGDLEAVDTIVGMFCEELPKGFGFSDTAFRVFILMASRRLKSDRFFTSDYTEEFYTRTGLDWIAQTGMREAIVRHFPELGKLIPKNKNPFAPWVAE